MMGNSKFLIGIVLIAVCGLVFVWRASEHREGGKGFEQVAGQLGIVQQLQFGSDVPMTHKMLGGLVVGDVNADGFEDVFVVGGPAGQSKLYVNQAGSYFQDLSKSYGLDIQGEYTGGQFADVDGDGDQDLLVTSLLASESAWYINSGQSYTKGQSFDQVHVFGSAVADIDHDGDLDMYLASWSGQSGLYINKDGLFVPGQVLPTAPIHDGQCGQARQRMSEAMDLETDLDFSPRFVDIDGDGWQDLLLTSDFGTSHVLRNNAGTFEIDTQHELTDCNGMGAAVGDIDNDGDMDWFVSSVYDQTPEHDVTWGTNGNRLYRNDGGVFADVSDQYGVVDGGWGWGACLADFDTDGWLDIFHVSGFPVNDRFRQSQPRLFMSQAGQQFVDQTASYGLDDTFMGRGVVCFDYDRDGDVDIATVVMDTTVRVYQNNINQGHHLAVQLMGNATIGSVVEVHTDQQVHTTVVQAGSNFGGNDSAVLHVGLGAVDQIEKVVVQWPEPSATTTVLHDVAVDQVLQIEHPNYVVEQ